MKRQLFIPIVALLFALVLIPAANAYANEIAVTANGQPVIFADQNPTIVDGRTLVPVAGVFQALGFQVEWNHSERQAVITRGADTVLITVGRNTFTKNGVDSSLDVPAQIINERTMLPIAAVLQSLDYNVDWDSVSRTVAITEGLTAAPYIAVAPLTRVDLSSLLRDNNFNEQRHLFGVQVGTNEGMGMHYTYFFEGGLHVSVHNDRIPSVSVDYRQAGNPSRHHFNGIDNTSTYDDVVAAFGNQPYNIRIGTDEERAGAVVSYGYWAEEHEFVRFFFDANDMVIAISFFLAQGPS